MATNERKITDDPRRDIHRSQAELNYLLEVFGDGLAAQEGWKSRLDGIEAVHYYLLRRHSWTPAQLREMSHEDLRFALSEELAGWTVPKARR